MHEPGQILQPEDTGTVHDEPHGGDIHPHVVPLWMLAAVFGALIVFTILTVAVTYVDLGSMNVWVALIIAAVKAVLVAEIFMHLRWDRPFNGVVFLIAIVTVFLFITIVFLDTTEYQPTVDTGPAPGLQQK